MPVVDVSEQMPKDADTLNAWINQLINTIIDAVDPSYGCEDATDGDTADSNANSDDSSAEGSATDDANAQDSKASTGSSTDPKYIRQCKAAHPVTHLRIRQRPMPPMAIPAMPPATTRPTPANS